MATIEIDGKKLEADAGKMIIEVADEMGIYIPRFCYHRKLSIAANCRMCLVEVERSPKPLPACATPINDGMKVFIQSSKAIMAQKAVMEFLLINHPLDCPICDQGGECELQDLSMGYGSDSSPYKEPKRSVHDQDLGPLISTEMTRCILCTRCVRFGQEIAGVPELGLLGRGELTEVSTYIQKSLTSELSGNIIDLCPVGALTSKPYRFKARAWELQQKPSIAPHDCLGSHVYVHSRGNKVMRVVPKDCEFLNETWLSDRDRFSYLGLESERLLTPMIKIENEWESCDWVSALQVTAKSMYPLLKETPEQVGSLISPSSSIEEAFLLSKIMHTMGSHHIDHRLHQCDFSDDPYTLLYPSSDILVPDIEKQDCILLLGSNLQREQPLIAHRVRKATLNNEAKVSAINPMAYLYYFNVPFQVVCHPYDWVDTLCALVKACHLDVSDLLPDLVQKINAATINDQIQAMADEFIKSSSRLIILGSALLNHPQASTLRTLAKVLTLKTASKLLTLTTGANSAGAWVAGCIPHRKAAGQIIDKQGLNAKQIIENKLKSYVLYNIDPEKDCANPAALTQSLKNAELVVAFTPYKTNYLLEHADVLLPIVPFTEMSGTFVNVEGRWQFFESCVSPLGESRPGWKVLRVLANMMNLSDFEYTSTQEIVREVKELLDKTPFKQELSSQPLNFDQGLDATRTTALKKPELTRIASWPLYQIDNLVRRSESLQHCAANDVLAAYMNQNVARKLNLNAGETVHLKQTGSAYLPVVIEKGIPDDCIFVANGYDETANLGESYGAIEVIKE